MTTVRRLFGLALLVTMVSTLGLLLSVYTERQQELTREGNRLYSTEAIGVSGNLAEILARWGGGDLAVYKDLDGSGHVRAVHGTSPERLAYPVHRGRSFEATDDQVALVGDRIELVDRQGRSFYDVDGHSYEVIGSLGRDADSLLQTDVLIADRDLFAEDGEERLVLDGQGVQARYTELFPGHDVEILDHGVNRRTSIDVVSPVLLTLGYGVQVLGALFIGLLAAAQVRERNRVAFLVGRSRGRLWAASLAEITGATATAAVVVWGIGRLVLDLGGAGVGVDLAVVVSIIALSAGTALLRWKARVR